MAAKTSRLASTKTATQPVAKRKVTQIKKPAVPKHIEVRELLRSRIQRLAPDSVVPSARELGATYNVSAMTVRQALVALQQDGLIYTVKGLGTFVADHKMSKRLTFVSFTQEVIERGMKPSSRIVNAEKVKITDQQVATDLQVEVGDFVYRIERVRMADNIPMALEESLIPTENAPGLLEKELKSSLYEIFRDSYERPVVRAECVVSPTNLTKRQAELLDTDIKLAALKFLLIAYDSRGRTMERCTSIKRGDRYDLRYAIQV
jgi:GntR family transcriptional regulator